ncbi:MAG: Asp-tRNA(Asn)/Glu-tRNA(Gln) amidotransferase subunit GatC [Candidatus Paceibacterota bacterium]|jgi:aspartyl-tRNA(Asn)/glutamyl-tRNA(Gln) amidotransferase subunit C
MIDIKDIEKLAELSRIKLTDEEKQKFGTEIESILAYVNQIQEVAGATASEQPVVGEVRNVMRPDTNSNESGANTEMILAEAPAREGDLLKVKKIL